MNVLFESHHDDGTLFSSYTILAHRPKVITVLGGETVQTNVDALTRKWETQMAMATLSVGEYQCWGFPERNPDWDDVWTLMRTLDGTDKIDTVWAPMPETQDGHEQHDRVGELALSVFGGRTRFYATYRRGSGRSRTDNEVIPKPDWPAVKFKAMSCYISQITRDDCRPWFNNWDREWVA